MRRRQVSPEALTALAALDIEGKLARITTGELPRPLYREVNECLVALGGKWNRKRRGHVFEEDPRDALDQVVLAGGLFSNRKRDFGFFETPQWIAERMVAKADIAPGQRVLEPSAGRGAILRALAAARLSRRVELTVIELLPENCRALAEQGWSAQLIEADFLLYTDKAFDRIVMNPPFARQADVDHVLHAYRLLAPSGRIVSILSAGLRFRRNHKTDTLRALIERNGTIEDLPEHAFRETGTDVRTLLVTLDKPNVDEGGTAPCDRHDRDRDDTRRSESKTCTPPTA